MMKNGVLLSITLVLLLVAATVYVPKGFINLNKASVSVAKVCDSQNETNTVKSLICNNGSSSIIQVSTYSNFTSWVDLDSWITKLQKVFD